MIGIKRIIVIIAAAAAALSFSLKASAAEEDVDAAGIYAGQYEAAGLDTLFSGLPQETRERLSAAGVEMSADTVPQAIDAGRLLAQAAEMLSEGSSTPLCGFTACFGIIILCALTEGFGIGVSEKRLSSVQGAAAAVCICAAVIVPLSSTIQRAAEVMNGASGFLLLYAPIMAALLAGSGGAAGAGTYYTSMLTAGNAVSLVSSRLVVPLMNVFLALSVT